MLPQPNTTVSLAYVPFRCSHCLSESFLSLAPSSQSTETGSLPLLSSVQPNDIVSVHTLSFLPSSLCSSSSLCSKSPFYRQRNEDQRTTGDSCSALQLGVFVTPLYTAQLPAASSHLADRAIAMAPFGCAVERALASPFLDGLIPQELADLRMWQWHLDVLGARRQECILQEESLCVLLICCEKNGALGRLQA